MTDRSLANALPEPRLIAQADDVTFHLLAESAEDCALCTLDPGGKIATWNSGAERLNGYRAEEIIGRYYALLYSVEDVRKGRCEHALVQAEQEGRFEVTGVRVRKGGGSFWAKEVMIALRDARGALLGFAQVTRDLSALVVIEEQRAGLAEAAAAREAAERLQASLATTLRSIGDAVITTDAHGRVTLMNAVAEELTGWREQEAAGRALEEVFQIQSERTRKHVPSPAARVLSTGHMVSLANHTVLVSRDGSRTTAVDDSGAPIRGRDGGIEGVVLVFRDVTQRKNQELRQAFLAEAAAVLAKSLDYRETLARVADLAVPGLADWCTVDILDDAAQAPERLAAAHVDPEKVKLAREWVAKYPPDPKAASGTAQVLRTGRSEIYPVITDEILVASIGDEARLNLARSLGLHSAMLVPLLARGRVLGVMSFAFAESGRMYTSDDLRFAEDLARRCAMAIDNAQLYAAEQRARQGADVANRSKDEFLATVSHELRTPLNAILGWAKIMADGKLTEQKRSRAIETIERNAVAMAQLIEDLLDVSRIISGKMRLAVQPVDVVEAVEAAIDSSRPAIEARGIRSVARLDPELESINGDPARVQQIVWNLLSNAVKFTPSGGLVEIALAQVDSSVEIMVKDSGKGIDPGFLPHIFDPFRQEQAGTTRTRGGLGLGLAITRQLVELHGGTIDAKSEGEGRGATFIVRLPVASAKRPSTLPPSTEARQIRRNGGFERPPQLQGLAILVVDDERDARELMQSLLGSCGSHVRTASCVEEAMQALAREHFDVLISDIGMPGQDGYDLIRQVRALPADRGGTLPAAALTAYARAEDRRRVLGAGYSMHVSKPVEPAELVSVIVSLTRFAPQYAP